MSAHDRIHKMISENTAMLFMKGDRDFPQCGFSHRAVQVLNALGIRYETFNVLEDPEIRQGIKMYSNWPTIPQLYLDGEFIGGSDIMIELFQNGELHKKAETLPKVTQEA